MPAIRQRTILALVGKTGYHQIAHGQQPTLGISIFRWPAGAQALNHNYLDTARLLTQVAPFVFMDGLFALKGGTAINLFIRDMPRLSVDLDLVLIPNKVLV